MQNSINFAGNAISKALTQELLLTGSDEHRIGSVPVMTLKLQVDFKHIARQAIVFCKDYAGEDKNHYKVFGPNRDFFWQAYLFRCFVYSRLSAICRGLNYTNTQYERSTWCLFEGDALLSEFLRFPSFNAIYKDGKRVQFNIVHNLDFSDENFIESITKAFPFIKESDFMRISNNLFTLRIPELDNYMSAIQKFNSSSGGGKEVSKLVSIVDVSDDGSVSNLNNELSLGCNPFFNSFFLEEPDQIGKTLNTSYCYFVDLDTSLVYNHNLWIGRCMNLQLVDEISEINTLTTYQSIRLKSYDKFTRKFEVHSATGYKAHSCFEVDDFKKYLDDSVYNDRFRRKKQS
jgi:hypothetical protein